jgi:D-alanyl-lipoteichoic acid acyltransferase DltB (MBOAT superfamily)
LNVPQFVYQISLDAATKAALYVVLAAAVLWPTYPYRVKQLLFCALNLVTAYVVFFPATSWEGLYGFLTLVAVGVAHCALIQVYNRGNNENEAIYWIAFAGPFLLLVMFRAHSTFQLLGVSYLTFRMAQTVFEMRGRDDLKAGVGEYFAFLFYPPTLSSGPINPFSYYSETADGRSISWHNISHGLLRIAIGYIKLRFLAAIPQQLTLSALWTGPYAVGYADYFVSGSAYYLYLYLNLGGYTDIVIGISALLGMRVRENFNYPLGARNVMEFWGRWHMSLTQFVRDAIFAPTMMTLTRWFGLAYSTPAALIAVFLIFTVLALWHGVAAGYFIFYVLHGCAFGAVYVLDQRQRKRGAKSYAAFKASPVRIWTGRMATFVFLGLTCPFLEWPTWKQIGLFPFM